MQDLHGVLAVHAECAPDAVAIVAPGRAPLTYALLRSQVDQVIETLRSVGVGQSDRVAVALPQGPETAVAILAVAAGATCVPVNPVLRAAEYEAWFADLGARALVVQAGTDSPARAAAAAGGLPLLELAPRGDAEAGLFRLAGPAGSSAAHREAAWPDAVALLLHTSGTTSRPKLVPLTHANVLASARNMGAALRLEAGDRCLDVMPLFHVHGLMAAIASLVAGASVVCPPRFEAREFFTWLDELSPTWYTAAPPFHQAIAAHARRHREALPRRRLRFIRSSSAPLPVPLAAQLEALFAAPVIEVYGMTEAANQIAANPLPPGRRKPGSVGLPAGTEVAVVDASGCALPTAETGEVVIRGPSVMRGYEGDAAANAAVFRDGWLRTGDLGFLDPDGYLFVTGRLKEIINRGGEKVSPREVDDVLSGHPAVAQAVTFAVPHLTLGEDVAAAVVLRERVAASDQELRAFVALRLADFKVPSRVVIVDEIPCGPSGKPQRIGLAERLGLAATDPATRFTRAPAAPRTPVEAALAEIWAEVLGIEAVGVHDDFLALGGNSLHAAMIVSRARAALGAELPLASLFEAPTVARLADRLESALAAAAAGGERPPLPGAPAEAGCRASFVQERLWFLDQLDPGNAVYNIPVVFRLSGPVDEAVLRRSLEEIVNRHEALRTTFAVVDGEPVQAVAAGVAVRMPVIDLGDLPPAEREARARRLTAEEAQRPFDLARGPLVRAMLLRLGADERLLLLTLHHIVADGWSLGILNHELSALYGAFLAGAPSPLPPLPVQYADFARQQRESLEGPALAARLAYWKAELAGGLPPLALSTDRPRPPVQTFRGARESRTLPRQLCDALGALGRREGVTLFMTLLGAFQTLLHRYTGEPVIAVGVPVAGRDRVELEGVIGCFINTVILRTDLAGDPTFRELLARVREVALGALEHRDTPFEKLVEALQPERDPSRTPLVQALFNMLNLPASPLVLPGVTVATPDPPEIGSKLDLTLYAQPDESGIHLGAVYNADLFDAATIARMLEHFGVLLEGIVADPDRRLSTLPLLTPAEGQRLLVEWNDTRADYARTACLHNLVEAQAARTPDAVAVVAGDARLTYREISRRANRLARHLRTLGVGRDTLVGVCLERSPEMVVALLAVLKAGGAYVPLDPAYPAERLAFMLEDARPALLLAHERLLPRLPARPGSTLCLDRDADCWAGEDESDPPLATDPDGLCYVVYTSGSTGRPKGVLTTHRGVVNYLTYLGRAWALGPSDAVLQLTSLSFDPSVREIFGALAAGARVVLLRDHEAQDPRAILGRIREHGVTALAAVVPTMLRALVAAAADEGLGAESVRTLLVSGEPLAATDCRNARGLIAPGALIVNQYGPTECTMTATYHRVTRADEARGSLPVGRPIQNTRVYVLDGALNPVPIGVAGEIGIAGVGVARGYLGRPELTAERFVPDPFTDARGARLYRTGDVGRWRPDGALEFLGRLDHQVKVRGNRVELGEIEGVLGEDPAVRAAVVMLRADAGGDPRLVAYVVPSGDPGPDAHELRRFLAERLPGYMVPTDFVSLDRLPLTPNGKVDRRALPPPDRGSRAPALEPPCTPIEAALARIWTEVLRTEPVGVHDDFFDLGGHSLLAARLLSRVRARLGVDLPLRALFDAPTVAGLAAAAAQRLADRMDPESVARALGETAALPEDAARPRRGGGDGETAWPDIPRRDPSIAAPLSFAQQRLWFLDQLEPGGAVYNIPWAARLRGPLDLPALRQALAAIVARHEALRTTFAAADGEPAQVIGEGRPPDLPVVDLAGWPAPEREAELGRRLDEEARRPFDLARDPMLRALVARLGAEEHVVLLTVHHIAADGWSMRILVRELGACYDAIAHGRPGRLPALPIQYADYAVWQRRWLRDRALETQLAYWKRKLAGAPPLLELPTDRPRPAAQSHRGAQAARVLSPALAAALKAVGRREGATLFMTLLAAFKALLHRYTGQDDVVVATAIAGRTRVETEALIGFFVNTLALRTDCSGDPAFRELLGRVRETALGAYAHQDLPFERLVEALAPERSLGRASLVQVMLVLHEGGAPALALPGLAESAAEAKTGTAKFDLSVSVAETADGLRMTAEYSTDLFDAETIERLLGHYERLLAGIVDDPSAPLSALPLLADAERHQLVVAWNDTREDYPAATGLHELFEAQARRTPDAPAVTGDGRELSYRGLDGRANQLARHLRLLGVGPGTLVGVCMERSLDLPVALLGVLKAGGAYLPLDPTYPRERLGFMLDDARPPVLLTQSGLRDRLPEHAARVVRLDADWDEVAGRSAEPVDGGASPDDLAYVIYTSGSTGRPKGVMVAHRAVGNFLRWIGKAIPLTTADAVLQIASASVDMSVWELFGSLQSGARVVMAPPDGQPDPRDLARLIAGEKITVLQCVPSLLRTLLEEPELGACTRLRRVISGGEALPAELAERFFARLDADLLNLYGPTETTVFSTVWTCAPGGKGHTVSIGRPIANTRVYVLDGRRAPVPIGMPGELYIGGAGLARGYLNRPELTAERFVPDPFGAGPGGRLYRTGDIVRYRADGSLEFLGRTDHQVKLRGVRIELGEIEAVLARHPAVRQTVLALREIGPGDARLVAYVVPVGVPPAGGELRRFLEDKLPRHMVPAHFVALAALPLTPNGKVDRRALPLPADQRPAGEGAFVPARTAVEARLAAIWAAILRVERVGVHDSFFDAGGHSLSATRLIAHVRDVFRVDLPLRTVFETPTVAGMAGRIAEALAARAAGEERALTGREALPGEEAQIEYWRRHLAGAPPVLDLPTDRPRPAAETRGGAHASTTVSRPTSEALKALARGERATLFMALLAALQTLLHRYTGQTDVVVGSAVAGRPRVETEGRTGSFVNTLALRTDLSGDPTFRELLGRVREVALGAYSHRDLPFEKLVEVLHPERSPGRSPLVQVSFDLQDAERPDFERAAATVPPLPAPGGPGRFELSLSMTDGPEGLHASLGYRTDLYDAATVERMLGHFRILLEGIAADPDRRLSRLPLLTVAERHQLVVAWNDTRADYPTDVCLHHLFEAQAARTPDAVAVAFEASRLSYRALNEQANRLAHHLRALGVGPEVLVGLCVERSPEMLIGLLGILKAGGAYVPLDPDYPKERLAFMLGDARAPVLVTREGLRARLPAHPATVVCLDAYGDTIAGGPTDNPRVPMTASHLAYVLYTSGSTGQPKGAMIEHRSLVNYLGWVNERLLDGRVERLAAVTRLTFDASLKQLVAPLLRGREVWILSDATVAQPEALLAALRTRTGVGLNCVPSLWRAVLDAVEAGTTAPSLTSLFVGGERLDPDLVERSFAHAPGLEIWNLYGPTEATANASAAPIVPGGAVTIGRPIANTRMYVLDPHLEPLPIGLAGELYIGGAGVARGYLNRPELTAERFVDDPFVPGARLYRTGDLARYRPDGAIEFLGRTDHQVKLRGFRIELGEIEAVLGRHPAVREAVALVREDAPGDPRLVAYVVPARGASPARADLRRFLEDKLPGHMVPARFVILDRLPLMPNGKVDRGALPAPRPDEPGADRAFVAPRTAIEETLAGIWSRVLGLARVGVDDNFFDRGGHSLSAVQLVSRVRDAFDVKLALQVVFEAPTVAAMAARISEALAADPIPERRAVPAARPRPSEPSTIPRRLDDAPVPLSFAQQRLWFLDQMTPRSPVYHIPWAVRLAGELDAAALRRALDAIVARHEALRTTFAAGDAGPVQVIEAPRPLEMPVVDLTATPRAGREVELHRRLADEARRPFDLARDPLLRALLVRVATAEHVLLLTVHHIAADGWSMGVLARELGALYGTFAGGRPAALPELPVQYADYAQWQRQWLREDALERQLSYWKRQLAGVPPVLELPADRPRPAAQSFAGARRSARLPGPLAGALRALSRREGVTLFMTLLAAFQVLLQRYTGQDDLVVGSPIAGRTRVELEPLIGFFVNTLVLRGDLSGDPTFRALLGRVREAALGAYANQDVPFERLVEEFQPERSLGRTPLFQVMFALQNVPREGLSLPGLTVSPVAVGTNTVPCDLTLALAEEGQELSASIGYDTDLFDAETVDRMLAHFESLLAGAVADPERPISTLPLLTDAERRQILVEWNDTRTAYPRDRTIPALFEDQVERTPDAVAVSGDGRQLTYRELDERANRLAHHLRRRGVGPGAPVGICVGRSPEMVVGLLGILKAGGAYLPLDPTYPKERLAFMLEDSGVSVLVTEARLAGQLPGGQAHVVRLDSGGDEIARERADRPAAEATPESLAYVVYTSGSTGTPKGVAVPHRAVVRLVMATNYVTVTPSDVMAQVSNASFDATTFELWGALLHGARLVVLPKDVVLSPGELAAALDRHRVTLLFLTTALFNQVAREAPSAFRGLRYLLFGGEAVEPRWVDAVLQHGPPERLLHVYGPTEATTFATWHCVRSVPPGATTLPIGRPIANTDVYLLDRGLNPVPVGVPGELHIGGPGLAVGYLNRPELTAEKFIRHSFSADPAERLYKSGDLARYLPDGSIEFLGRRDQQVKLRGFRIELGEVEAALSRHPGVGEVVVVAREDAPGQKRLVAYVVRSPEAGAPAGDFRRFLKERLPEYMVPERVVFLPSLPLTPNGKVDRGALPPPAEERAEPGSGLAGPMDPLQDLLLQIWEDLLDVRPIGIRDNFFDLGGHSLLAACMVRLVEHACGRWLPLTTLFEGATVEHLAQALVRQDAEAFRSPVTAVQAGGSRPPFFFLHGDFNGGGFYCVRLARLLGPEQPFYALHPHGLDGRPVRASIEAMAADHLAALRTIQPAGPYRLGGHCAGGLVAFEMARRLRADGERVDLLALLDAVPGSRGSRILRALVDGAAAVRGLGPDARRRAFTRAREQSESLQARARYYGKRLHDLSRAGVSAQTGFLRELLRRGTTRLAGRRPAEPAVSGGARARPETLSDAYRWVLAGYVPRRYPGRITLFRTAQPEKGPLDLGWRAVADEVEVHVMPGNHLSFITRHVQVLGERLRECLEDAQGK